MTDYHITLSRGVWQPHDKNNLGTYFRSGTLIVIDIFLVSRRTDNQNTLREPSIKRDALFAAIVWQVPRLRVRDNAIAAKLQ